jgi:hypothetical protein
MDESMQYTCRRAPKISLHMMGHYKDLTLANTQNHNNDALRTYQGKNMVDIIYNSNIIWNIIYDIHFLLHEDIE